MHSKQFLSPAEVAAELEVSSATVLRLIHSGALPAIRVSERIYRIPIPSFEMYKSGSLRSRPEIRLRRVAHEPRLDQGEDLPTAHRTAASAAR